MSGMAGGHAFEKVLEIGVGLDTVELCRSDQTADHGPAFAAAVGAGKEMVFAAERDRPDGALDWVIVDVDPAVIEEATQRRPTGQSIANGLGQGAAGRDARKSLLEPGLHSLDDWLAFNLAHQPALFSGTAPDAFFDAIEGSDPT